MEEHLNKLKIGPTIKNILLGISLPATNEELLKNRGIGSRTVATLRAAGLVKPGFKLWNPLRDSTIAWALANIERCKSDLKKAEADLAKAMEPDIIVDRKTPLR